MLDLVVRFMGLVALLGLGFGWDLGLEFGSLLEIDYGEDHKEHEHVILKKLRKQ